MLNQKKLDTKLLESLVRKQKAVNITANAQTTGDASISVSDSKLRLVVGFAIGSTDAFVPVQCYFESATSIKCRVRNMSGSTQTGSFTVFYL